MKIFKTESGITIKKVLGGHSNVFLIESEKLNILVDTSPSFFWKKLKKNLNKLNINKIDYLLLTHTHYDHTGNAERIKQIYGAKVIVSSKEKDIISNGLSPIPKGTQYFSKIISTIGVLLSKGKNVKPCISDIEIEDEYIFENFDNRVKIVQTPGHTEGSLSIIVDNEIAIVGDAMFGVFPNSVYPPFADNEKEMIKSWKKLLDTGCRIFLPSHGSEVSFNKLKENIEIYL